MSLREIFSIYNLVYWLIAGIGISLCLYYVYYINLEKREMNKLRVFMNFIEQVSYQYTICQCVEESILESMDRMDKQIEDVVEEIYQLLLLEDVDQIEVYKKKQKNSFYYQFVLFSYLAMEYGDDVHNSYYLKNLVFLKKQVFLWILDREQLNYYLSGIAYIVILPIQCLKGVELWASSNLSELGRYYEGTYGIVSRFILLLVTLVCYVVVIFLRHQCHISFYQEVYIKRLSEMLIITKLYDWWTEHNPKKVKLLSDLLRKGSSRISLRELFAMRLALAGATCFACVILFEPLVGVVGGYVGLIGLLLIGMIWLGYHLPLFYFVVRIKVMRMEKEDEAYFFYSIAQMVATMGRGDVDDVLEWIELGSVIFTPTLQKCMDDFSYDNECALETGKMLEPFQPFVKLLDALQLSEQIGLERAIYPLVLEQEQYFEKRKQDNYILTENKGVLGRFIAFIPLGCTIGIYLIIPFVLESIMQLKKYIEQLQIGL